MQINSIIGKKREQTQGFLEDGTRIPLSILHVAENIVTQVKSSDKDGYNAVQVGFDFKKKLNKALSGHVKKAGVEKFPRFFRELKAEDIEVDVLGKELKTTEILKPGDMVKVTGVSKGKGYAGVVKRWGFRGGPRTHGQSDRERAPGSIGQTTTPGRVYKGKKMAGKMGNDQITIRNLVVMDVTDQIVSVKGLIPGSIGSIVRIEKIGEYKKFTPLYKKEDLLQSEVKADEEIVGSTEPVVEKEEVFVEDNAVNDTADVSSSETKAEEIRTDSELEHEIKEDENAQS